MEKCKLTKRNERINIRVLLTFISSLCLSVQSSFSTDYIWVRPYEIKFNYDNTGYSDDAINIKTDKDSYVIVPEWEYNGDNPPISRAFAYIMGQSNRKIKVRFDSNCQSMHLLINISVTSGTGIGTICNTFVENYSELDEITLTLTGAIPNSVGIRNFTWHWDIYAIPNNPSYCSSTSTYNTNHRYRTLLAAPQAPMSEPWTGVLDRACEWASGQTNSSGIIQKLVEGLYNNTGFLYDVLDGSSRYTGKYSTSFNLTIMLSEIGGDEIVVNCYDMGKAVTIFANALGLSSGYVLSDPFGYLNCIKPIGRDWTNNPFYEGMYPPYDDLIEGEDDPNRSFFGNHAFCSLGDIINDATLKVDTDSNPDAPPHTESWATGWNWTTYKSKVIDNNPSPPYGTGDPTPYSFEVF